jgi:hypothetical protein
MDRDTAEWLQTMFPGATVGMLGSGVQVQKGKPGRPQKHAEKAARDAAYHARKKAEKLLALDALQDGNHQKMSVFDSIRNVEAESVFEVADVDRHGPPISVFAA